jgi:hypothetical protein
MYQGSEYVVMLQHNPENTTAFKQFVGTLLAGNIIVFGQSLEIVGSTPIRNLLLSSPDSRGKIEKIPGFARMAVTSLYDAETWAPGSNAAHSAPQRSPPQTHASCSAQKPRSPNRCLRPKKSISKLRT